MEANKKVYLVTGATKGIGKAVALDLLSTGAQVAVTSSTQESFDQAREELGGVLRSFRLIFQRNRI